MGLLKVSVGIYELLYTVHISKHSENDIRTPQPALIGVLKTLRRALEAEVAQPM